MHIIAVFERSACAVFFTSGRLPICLLSFLSSLPLSPISLSQAQRLHEKKEHSTSDQVLDPKTRLMLFKMVDNQVLTEINGCVSTGKEACVFHAGGGR